MKRTRQQKIFYYTQPMIFRKKMEELDTCEEKVFRLLKDYEDLTNSDKLLLYYYWRLVDNYKGELDNNTILNLTPAESITRARRHLQELAKENPDTLGFLLPTDIEVMKSRNIDQEAVKEWAKTCHKYVYGK